MRRALGLAAFFVSACIGARALAQDGAGASAPATPLGVDEVEEITEAAMPWLHQFEDWVREGGEPPPMTEWPLGDGGMHGPFWSGVPADGFESVELRGAKVQRSTGATTTALLSQFRESLLGEHLSDPLSQPLSQPLGASEIAFKSKVIAVQPALAALRHMSVRLEMTDASEPARWQAVAELKLSLTRGADGSLTFHGVHLESVQRTSVDEPLLVEKTAGVFANQPAVAELLGVGMDRWAQRLDDSGLTAWFGHQGLAVGDANGDGWDDLYVAMPSGLPNLLLVSQSDGTVKDVAKEAGVAWLDDTKGVLFVDVNGDGRDDIVSALGHVIAVQYGDGKGGFQVGGWCVAPDETPFYGISATDFDDDGDLDLYGVRYVTTRYGDSLPVPFHEARNGPSNHFYRNTERGFQDVTAPIGLREPDGGRFSLAAQFVDHDGDGDDDLYVVNDFGSNQLYEFAGGRFIDKTQALGAADPGAGMGASWSDYDLDGDVDLYVTNMFSSAGRRVAFQEAFAAERGVEARAGIQRLSLGNTLLRRGGEGFEDIADASGTRMGRWAWGACFVDLNGDGYDDLVSPAGFLTGPKPGDL